MIAADLPFSSFPSFIHSGIEFPSEEDKEINTMCCEAPDDLVVPYFAWLVLIRVGTGGA